MLRRKAPRGARGRLRPSIGWRVAAPVLAGCLALASSGAPAPVRAAPTAAGAGVVSSASGPAPANRRRPNIVIVFTDDMRLDDLPYMPRTRRLIGNAGVRYSRGLSENPLCCPFRAVLLTGQYTHNNGVLTNKGEHGGVAALSEQATLNVAMERRGYHTAYIGKYLNGYPSSRTRRGRRYVPPGWTEWHVPVRHIYNYDRVTMNHNGRLRTHVEHRADLLARIGSRTITHLARKDKPFFAAISYLAPHSGATSAGWSPPVPAPRHAGSLRGRMPARMPGAFNEADVSDKPAFIRRLSLLSPKHKKAMRRLRRRRAESLASVDQAIARQVAALRRAGALRNTIVAFASDNGLLLGEHRLRAKKIVPYEESIRVPLMIRGPGFPSGTRDHRLVGAVDLASTFAYAAGVAAHLPHPVDGRDLRPRAARGVLLETGPKLVGGPIPGVRRAYVGVRTERFMYARYWTGQEELYDLTTDPYQLDSLHDDPAYAATLEELRADTQRLKDCSGTACRE